MSVPVWHYTSILKVYIMNSILVWCLGCELENHNILIYHLDVYIWVKWHISTTLATEICNQINRRVVH
jgi:hypothetical protein